MKIKAMTFGGEKEIHIVYSKKSGNVKFAEKDDMKT
jgi:hypothetical protein